MIDDKSIDSAGFPSRKCQHLFQKAEGAFHSVPNEPKSSLAGTGPVCPTRSDEIYRRRPQQRACSPPDR